jgi:hypothetical protein
MATSDKTQKSAASSTPAAQPAASQAAVENDALPSSGAVRGDMLDIKAALAVELDQRSDGQNDENSGAADSEDSARLDEHDEQEAAQAAAELAGDAQAEDDSAEDGAAEGAEADADSDAAPTADAPESQEAKPAEGEAAKPKHEALQERFNELTARAKGAEEQLAAANEQLAAFRARDEGTLTPDVLDHVDSPEDLTKAQQRYSALLQWAIKHPEGGKLGERDYSPEEVRDLHAEVQTLMTDALPARRDYLAQRSTADREAVDFYPWLKDTTRGAGALAHQAIKQIPALRKLPNHRMIVADAVVGQALRQSGVQLTGDLLKRLAEEAKTAQAKGKAPAKPAAPQGQRPALPAKPPASPGRAGVLPPRQTPRAAAAKAAGNRLRQGSGTEDELADSIASKL